LIGPYKRCFIDASHTLYIVEIIHGTTVVRGSVTIDAWMET
jgi:hypothetical protein